MGTKVIHQFLCPGCGLIGRLDDDQWNGRVSIDCPECAFHETINLAACLAKGEAEEF
jgi:hypothetical protein